MQSDGSTFTIDGDVTNDDTVFGFDFTIKKVTLSVRLFRSRVIPQNTRVCLSSNEKEQRASGVKIGRDFARAISFSFDFAVGAGEVFNLNVEDGDVITQATVVILIEME